MGTRTEDPATKAIRTTLLSVVANAGLAAIKGLAGVLGHSYALIADAMESVMDIFKALVVWGGLTIATQPPDENHPYGHGKAEPLAAIVVALTLVAGAIGLAIQSVREIMEPAFPPAPYTLIVLVGVVIVKELLFRYVSAVGEEIDSSAVKSNAWDNRSDAITSAAAFIGISIALIGGEGYESADDYAALFACGIIAYNGYRLLRPALGEIMDAAPPPDVEQGVRATAGEVEGVQTIERCMIRKMGLVYFVDLHVEVDGAVSVFEGHTIAHRVKNAIRRADSRIGEVLVHVEPAGGVDRSAKID